MIDPVLWKAVLDLPVSTDAKMLLLVLIEDGAVMKGATFRSLGDDSSVVSWDEAFPRGLFQVSHDSLARAAGLDAARREAAFDELSKIGVLKTMYEVIHFAIGEEFPS